MWFYLLFIPFELRMYDRLCFINQINLFAPEEQQNPFPIKWRVLSKTKSLNRHLVATILCVSKCSQVSKIDQLVFDRWRCKQPLLQLLPVLKWLVMHLLSSITIFFTILQNWSIGFIRNLV